VTNRVVLFAVLIATVLVGIIATPAISEMKDIPPPDSSIRYTLARELSTGKGVCETVVGLIKAGMSSAQVVENAILLGHSPCVVVRCAIDAGGELEDVITAAFRADANSEVILTCCILAGIPIDALARILECRGYPCLWENVVTARAATVGGGGGGIPVSPFRP